MITNENIRRLATVVKDSNDAIMVQDFEGHITTWNSGAEQMFGYSEEEALKMDNNILTPPPPFSREKGIHSPVARGRNNHIV